MSTADSAPVQDSSSSHLSVPLPRRAFLIGTPVAVLELPALAGALASRANNPALPYAGFPAHDPALVREMVGASHNNLAKVRELLKRAPELAKAAWDWGFGDWESALGAASHVGNREIAAVLMEHGARPDLFTFAMLGQLEVVMAYIAANPGVQRTHGPHGITLLAHARAGGERNAAVVEFLQSLGDADRRYETQPLGDDQRAAYLGRYALRDDGREHLEITQPKPDELAVKFVPGGNNRGLFHLGDHTFHPVGAPAARLRFEVSGGRAIAVVVGLTGVEYRATRVE